MGVIKKLLCKKLQLDKEKPDDESTADVSSIDDLPAAMKFVSLDDDSSTYHQSSQLHEEIEAEIGSLDFPADWVIDYNILETTTGARRIDARAPTAATAAKLSTSTADDDYIVEEVRRSLRPSRKKGRKTNSKQNGSDKKGSSLAPCPGACMVSSSHSQMHALESWLLGGPSKEEKTGLAANLERAQAAILQTKYKNKLALRGSTALPPSYISAKKKTRWAAQLEEREARKGGRYQSNAFMSRYGRYSSRLGRHRMSSRLGDPTDGFADDDSERLASGSVDVFRSFDDNSTAVSQETYSVYDERSVETIELVCNHLTCNPQDRLEAGDWIR